jgi:hypothetical protein
MELYKKNYDPKRIPRTSEAEKKKETKFIRAVRLTATGIMAGPALFTLFLFSPYAEVDYTFPEVFASETVHLGTDKETEEEALTRRTEEIFLEQAATYWKDAEKKALAEKADALNKRIASTTALTPEDAANAKKVLNKAKSNLP